MNQLPHSLQNLWADMVDKRLWPIAAGLLALVLVMPVLLLKSGPDDAAIQSATAPVPPQPTAGQGSLIADVTGTAYVGPVRGEFKNPFKPRRLPSIAPVGGGAGGGAPAGGPVPGPVGPPGGPGEAPPPDPTPTPPLPGDEPDVVVSVEFGLDGGEQIERELAELAPLPSPTSPAVVFVGLSKDKEAVFMVSSDVKVAEGGRCEPSPETCSKLHLDRGDTAILEVGTTAERTLRYRLKFVRVIG